jgi:hypothetical protein
MRALAVLIMILAAGSLVAATSCSRSIVDKRAARPGLMERVKQDAVTGEVTDFGKKYVAVRQDNGETIRVRVDESTKMDTVQVGDRVKAYTDEVGYASTLRRLAKD